MSPLASSRSARSTCASAGFTLIEILVVVAIIGMGVAIVVPNLGALIPSARLDGSGQIIRRKLDWVRSEARIQAKRMAMEFDLDKARWRIVWPPEERLTRDDVIVADEDIADDKKDWMDLETDVVFRGAGGAGSGLAEHGRYQMVFDEYGFTADQLLVLTLKSDPEMVWAMSIQGLSGQVRVDKSDSGEIPRLDAVEEGAF